MFKRLIIPLDGSRLSEAVLPAAVFLTEKLHASVTLVHVIERNAPTQVHGEPHLSRPDEAEAYLETVRRLFPAGVAVDVHVHTNAIEDVGRSIVEHAHEFESDLVMMCTHGRSGLRKMLFGSIAQQVVAAKVPVLLVHPKQGGAAPVLSGGRFMIPLDGSEIREAGLPAARELAQHCGASLKLLMVVPTLNTLSGVENTSRILLPATTKEMLAQETEDAKSYLRQWIERLTELGAQVSARIRRGDATKSIIEEAQGQEFDLIVMGTSGKAGMDAFWSGSVAPRVSEKTHLPVLLIPKGGS